MFEPLRLASLRSLTKKVLFLFFALATAKQVGELQAHSRSVLFVHEDACVSYVPEFVAKTESLSTLIPRSFLVKILPDFVAGLQEELLLCPVCALCIYLDRTASFSPLPRHLFLSPHRPSRALLKNAISYFLCEVIHEAEAGRPEVGPVRAHSIRGVSTSATFHHNWSVASVLESATWHSSSVCVSLFLSLLSSHPRAEVFYIGDFNVHHTDWLKSTHTDVVGIEAFHFSISNELEQIIKHPTRVPDRHGHAANPLDLFFTSNPQNYTYTVSSPLGSSDHCTVSVTSTFTPPPLIPPT